MNRTNRRVGQVLALGGVLGIAIVFGVSRLLAPPATPPAYNEKPAIVAGASMVSHTETIVIDVPLEAYSAWSNQVPLESLLLGDSNVPSVVRTDLLQGTWGEVGARRRVVLSDGHYAGEEILANDQPTLFRYQVWGYTNFARFATDYAVGEFRHEAVGEQTQVTWTYSFQRKSPLTDPLLEKYVNTAWANYMRAVLQVMKEQSESMAVGS